MSPPGWRRRCGGRSPARSGGSPDGSLFLPMRLDAGEKPYDTVTESRAGSYWNLVAPYALASGLFPPRSPQAQGALRYLLTHGSRLLGMVRASAFSLYGPGAEPAHVGHRPGVRRERVAVPGGRGRARPARAQPLRPARGGHDAEHVRRRRGRERRAARRAALPGDVPAAERVANDSFLETLRLHARAGHGVGAPAGVRDAARLARRGEADRGDGAPTRFGPVSYSLGRVGARGPRPSRVRRAAAEELLLRLRLPAGRHIVSVHARGAPFDRATGTIDLSGATGPLDLVVRTT